MGTGGRPTRPTVSAGQLALASVAYTAAYLGAAAWADHFTLGGPVLVWFPGAGVAVGAAYFLGLRLLPVAIVAEALSSTLVFGVADDFGMLWLAVNSVVLAGCYVLAGMALRRHAIDPTLRHLRDVGVLAIDGLLLAPTLAAVLGVAIQVAAGLVPRDDLARSIGLFWVGDVVGIAAVTPAVLVVGVALRHGRPAPWWRRPLPLSDHEGPERAILVVLELMVPAALAVGIAAAADPGRFLYLTLVPMVAIAVRHGVDGAVLASAALAASLTAVAHVETVDALTRSDVQLLLAVAVITGLALGAAVSSRADVLEHHRNLSEIIEATPDLIATADPDGRLTYLNPSGRLLLGIDPMVEIADTGSLAQDWYADEVSRQAARGAATAAARDGTWTGDAVLQSVDGRRVPVSQVVIAHRTGDGEVRSLSTVCRDETTPRRLADELARATLTDTATGLANRAVLVDRLGRLLAGGGGTGPPGGQPVALVVIGVGRLEVITESLGHDAADRVVGRIGQVVARNVEGSDLVARCGADRVAVVLPGIDDAIDVLPVAAGVLAACSTPVALDGREVAVTPTIGLALGRPGERGDDLLRAGEVALGRAAQEGRQIAVFDDDADQLAHARLHRDALVRRIVSTGAWHLAYQPLVAVGDRRIVGCEALLRPAGAYASAITTFQLITLAEESAQIVELGREVLRQACEQAARWHRSGYELSVAVNVSGVQLREPGFGTEVATVVADTGIDPARLTLELTETALGEVGPATAALDAVRASGCRIALDDFGTGWSSLAALRHLPIDVVKLDRTLVSDVARSDRSRDSVAALVSLARALDLEVVAEGVEDASTLDALVALGCGRAQGYLFAPALAPDELVAMVGDEPWR